MLVESRCIRYNTSRCIYQKQLLVVFVTPHDEAFQLCKRLQMDTAA